MTWHNRRLRKWTAALTTGVFLFSTLAAPFAQAQSFAPPAVPAGRETLAGGIDFPVDAGTSVESRWFSSAHPLTVFHIQDAHGIAGAQFNAARILKFLVDAGAGQPAAGPLLVCVEGAAGPLDTDWLSAFPSSDARRRVADGLLSHGRITGEELRAIHEAPGAVRLVGIEDRPLYDRHVAAKMAAERARKRVESAFADFDRRLDGVRRAVYSPPLARFDALRRDFDSQKVSLAAFFAGLRPLLPAGVSLDRFPQVKLASDLSAAEARLNRAEVDAERELVLGRMVETLPAAEVNGWVALALDVRLGRVQTLEYARRLLELAGRLGVKAPALAEYADVLDAKRAVDETLLSDELDAFLAEAGARLAFSPAAARAARLADWLQREEKFWRLELSPSEWQRRRGEPDEAWRGAIAELEALERAAGRRSAGFMDLRAAWQSTDAGAARRYYEAALRRDDVLARNALKAIRDSKATRAVLIAGGFHTPGLLRALQSEQVSYVVVRPSFSAPSVVPGADAKRRYAGFRRSLSSVAGALRAASQLPERSFQLEVTADLLSEARLADPALSAKAFEKMVAGWTKAFPEHKSVFRSVRLFPTALRRDGRDHAAGVIRGEHGDFPFLMTRNAAGELELAAGGEAEIREWSAGAKLENAGDGDFDADGLAQVWPFLEGRELEHLTGRGVSHPLRAAGRGLLELTARTTEGLQARRDAVELISSAANKLGFSFITRLSESLAAQARALAAPRALREDKSFNSYDDIVRVASDGVTGKLFEAAMSRINWRNPGPDGLVLRSASGIVLWTDRDRPRALFVGFVSEGVRVPLVRIQPRSTEGKLEYEFRRLAPRLVTATCLDTMGLNADFELVLRDVLGLGHIVKTFSPITEEYLAHMARTLEATVSIGSPSAQGVSGIVAHEDESAFYVVTSAASLPAEGAQDITVMFHNYATAPAELIRGGGDIAVLRVRKSFVPGLRVRPADISDEPVSPAAVAVKSRVLFSGYSDRGALPALQWGRLRGVDDSGDVSVDTPAPADPGAGLFDWFDRRLIGLSLPDGRVASGARLAAALRRTVPGYDGATPDISAAALDDGKRVALSRVGDGIVKDFVAVLDRVNRRLDNEGVDAEWMLVGGAFRALYSARVKDVDDFDLVMRLPEAYSEQEQTIIDIDYTRALAVLREEFGLPDERREVKLGSWRDVPVEFPGVVRAGRVERYDDCSFNAVYLRTNGLVIDKVGGMRDYRAGIIRWLPATYAQQPSLYAILRGLNISYRHGFVLDAATRETFLLAARRDPKELLSGPDSVAPSILERLVRTGLRWAPSRDAYLDDLKAFGLDELLRSALPGLEDLTPAAVPESEVAQPKEQIDELRRQILGGITMLLGYHLVPGAVRELGAQTGVTGRPAIPTLAQTITVSPTGEPYMATVYVPQLGGINIGVVTKVFVGEFGLDYIVRTGQFMRPPDNFPIFVHKDGTVRMQNGGYVAVDPRYIPLGSRVTIWNMDLGYYSLFYPENFGPAELDGIRAALRETGGPRFGANLRILAAMGISAEAFAALSDDQAAAKLSSALNGLLADRTFPGIAGVPSDSNLISGRTVRLLGKPVKRLSALDLLGLNRALLQALYPVETRRTRELEVWAVDTGGAIRDDRVMGRGGVFRKRMDVSIWFEDRQKSKGWGPYQLPGDTIITHVTPPENPEEFDRPPLWQIVRDAFEAQNYEVVPLERYRKPLATGKTAVELDSIIAEAVEDGLPGESVRVHVVAGHHRAATADLRFYGDRSPMPSGEFVPKRIGIKTTSYDLELQDLPPARVGEFLRLLREPNAGRAGLDGYLTGILAERGVTLDALAAMPYEKSVHFVMRVLNRMLQRDDLFSLVDVNSPVIDARTRGLLAKASAHWRRATARWKKKDESREDFQQANRALLQLFYLPAAPLTEDVLSGRRDVFIVETYLAKRLRGVRTSASAKAAIKSDLKKLSGLTTFKIPPRWKATTVTTLAAAKLLGGLGLVMLGPWGIFLTLAASPFALGHVYHFALARSGLADASDDALQRLIETDRSLLLATGARDVKLASDTHPDNGALLWNTPSTRTLYLSRQFVSAMYGNRFSRIIARVYLRHEAQEMRRPGEAAAIRAEFRTGNFFELFIALGSVPILAAEIVAGIGSAWRKGRAAEGPSITVHAALRGGLLMRIRALALKFRLTTDDSPYWKDVRKDLDKRNFDLMSRAAARHIADRIREKPDLVLGLATGSTPLGVYRELVKIRDEEGLDVSQLRIFHLDEYAGLPGTHPQSYQYYLWENFLKHLADGTPTGLKRENIRYIDGMAADPEGEGARYEEEIRQAGGIDIQILGIGSNGHIAFNEPGSAFDSRTRLVQLAESTIRDNARFFVEEVAGEMNLPIKDPKLIERIGARDRSALAELLKPEQIDEFYRRLDGKVPRRALSQGIGTILEARELILLANGRGKADAVRKSFRGAVTERVPASFLQRHPNVRVDVDFAAARLLGRPRPTESSWRLRDALRETRALRQLESERFNIGVSVGGTKIAVAAVTQSGGVHLKQQVNWRDELGPNPSRAELLKLITNLISSVSQKAGIDGVGEIGVAWAGPGDYDNGIVYGENMSGFRWRELSDDERDEGGVRLAQMLGTAVYRATGRLLPVKVLGDASAAGFVEYGPFGTLPEDGSGMAVIWGTGIGGGFVVDGKPFYGGAEVGRRMGSIGHHLVWNGSGFDYYAHQTQGKINFDYAGRFFEHRLAGPYLAVRFGEYLQQHRGNRPEIDDLDGLVDRARERNDQAGRTLLAFLDSHHRHPAIRPFLEEIGYELGQGLGAFAAHHRDEKFIRRIVLMGGVAENLARPALPFQPDLLLAAIRRGAEDTMIQRGVGPAHAAEVAEGIMRSKMTYEREILAFAPAQYSDAAAPPPSSGGWLRRLAADPGAKKVREAFRRHGWWGFPSLMGTLWVVLMRAFPPLEVAFTPLVLHETLHGFINQLFGLKLKHVILNSVYSPVGDFFQWVTGGFIVQAAGPLAGRIPNGIVGDDGWSAVREYDWSGFHTSLAGPFANNSIALVSDLLPNVIDLVLGAAVYAFGGRRSSQFIRGWGLAVMANALVAGRADFATAGGALRNLTYLAVQSAGLSPAAVLSLPGFAWSALSFIITVGAAIGAYRLVARLSRVTRDIGRRTAKLASGLVRGLAGRDVDARVDALLDRVAERVIADPKKALKDPDVAQALGALGLTETQALRDRNFIDPRSSFVIPTATDRVESSRSAVALLKANPRYASYGPAEWGEIERRFAGIDSFIPWLKSQLGGREIKSIIVRGGFINDTTRPVDDLDLLVVLEGSQNLTQKILKGNFQAFNRVEAVLIGEKELRAADRDPRLTAVFHFISRWGQTLWGEKLVEALPPALPEQFLDTARTWLEDVEKQWEFESMGAFMARRRFAQFAELIKDAGLEPPATAEEIEKESVENLIDDFFHMIPKARQELARRSLKKELVAAWASAKPSARKSVRARLAAKARPPLAKSLLNAVSVATVSAGIVAGGLVWLTASPWGLLGATVGLPHLVQALLIAMATHGLLPDQGLIPEWQNAPPVLSYIPPNPGNPRLKHQIYRALDRYRVCEAQLGTVAVRADVMRRLPFPIQRWFFRHELDHLHFEAAHGEADSRWLRLWEEFWISMLDFSAIWNVFFEPIHTLGEWLFDRHGPRYPLEQDRFGETGRANPAVVMWLRTADLPAELVDNVSFVLRNSPDVWDFEALHRLIEIYRDPRIDDHLIDAVKTLSGVSGLSTMVRRLDLTVFDVRNDVAEWDDNTLKSLEAFRASLGRLMAAADLRRKNWPVTSLGGTLRFSGPGGETTLPVDAVVVPSDTGEKPKLVVSAFLGTEFLSMNDAQREAALAERVDELMSSSAAELLLDGIATDVRGRFEIVVPMRRAAIPSAARAVRGEWTVSLEPAGEWNYFDPNGKNIHAHRAYAVLDRDVLRREMNRLRLQHALLRGVRAVVSDIDQTLAVHGQTLTPENQEYMRRLLSLGVPVILITGKSDLDFIMDKQIGAFVDSLSMSQRRKFRLHTASGSRVYKFGRSGKPELEWQHPVLTDPELRAGVKRIVAEIFQKAIERFQFARAKHIPYPDGDVLDPGPRERDKLAPAAVFIESEIRNHPQLAAWKVDMNVTVGGNNDIGVDPSGKGAAIGHIMETLGIEADEIFYLGDSFFSYGNDNPVRRRYRNVNYAHVDEPLESTAHLQALVDFVGKRKSTNGRGHYAIRAGDVRVSALASAVLVATPLVIAAALAVLGPHTLGGLAPAALLIAFALASAGTLVHAFAWITVSSLGSVQESGPEDPALRQLVEAWASHNLPVKLEPVYLAEGEMAKRFGEGATIAASPAERRVYVRRAWVTPTNNPWFNVLRGVMLPMLLRHRLETRHRPFSLAEYYFGLPFTAGRFLLDSLRLEYDQSLKPFTPTIWARRELYEPVTKPEQMDTPDIADNFLGKLEYDLKQWRAGKAARPVVYIRNTGGGGDVLNNIYLGEKYKKMGAEVVLISIFQKYAGLKTPKDFAVKEENPKEEDPIWKWDGDRYVYDHGAGYGRSISDAENVDPVNEQMFRPTAETRIKESDGRVAEAKLVDFMKEHFGPDNFYMVAMKESPEKVAEAEYKLFQERFKDRNVYVVVTGTGGDFISTEFQYKASPVNEEFHMLVLRQMIKFYDKKRAMKAKESFAWRSIVFQESSPGADVESTPAGMQKVLDELWDRRLMTGVMLPYENTEGAKAMQDAVKLGISSKANMRFVDKVTPYISRFGAIRAFIAAAGRVLPDRVVAWLRAIPLPNYFAVRGRLFTADTYQRTDTYNMFDMVFEIAGGRPTEDSFYFHWTRTREWLVEHTNLPPPSRAKHMPFQELAVALERAQGSTREGIKPTESEILILERLRELKKSNQADVLRAILSGQTSELMPDDIVRFFRQFEPLVMRVMTQSIDLKLQIVSMYKDEDGKDKIDAVETDEIRTLILLTCQRFLDRTDLPYEVTRAAASLLKRNPLRKPTYSLYVFPRPDQKVDVPNAISFARRIYQWRDRRPLSIRLASSEGAAGALFEAFDMILNPHDNAFIERNIEFDLFDLADRALKELSYVYRSVPSKRRHDLRVAMAELQAVLAMRYSPKALELGSASREALWRVAQRYQKTELHRHISGSLSPLLLMVLYWRSPTARRQFIAERLKESAGEAVDVDARFAERFGGPADPASRAGLTAWLLSLQQEKIQLNDPVFVRQFEEFFGGAEALNESLERAKLFIEYRPRRKAANEQEPGAPGGMKRGTLDEYVRFMATGEIPLRNDSIANRVAIRESILEEYFRDNVTLMELQLSGVRPAASDGSKGAGTDTLESVVKNYMLAFDEVEELSGGHARASGNVGARKEPGAVLPLDVIAERRAAAAEFVARPEFAALTETEFIDRLVAWVGERVVDDSLSRDEKSEERRWLADFREQLLLHQQHRRLEKPALADLVFMLEANRREQLRRVQELADLKERWADENPRWAARIVGMASFGSENDFFPWTILPAMRLAARRHLKTSIHVGESWAHGEERMALLRVRQIVYSGYLDRLEHGTILGVLPRDFTERPSAAEILEIRALQRDLLMYLAASGTPVVSMPTSNVELSVFGDYAHHLLQFFSKQALRVAVAQDNSWIFHTRGSPGERIKVWEAHPDMKWIEWLAIEQNGFNNAFTPNSLQGLPPIVTWTELAGQDAEIGEGVLAVLKPRLAPDRADAVVRRLTLALDHARAVTKDPRPLADIAAGLVAAATDADFFGLDREDLADRLSEVSELLEWNPPNASLSRRVAARVLGGLRGKKSPEQWRAFWGEAGGLHRTLVVEDGRKTFDTDEFDIDWMASELLRRPNGAAQEFDAISRHSAFDFRYKARLIDLYRDFLGVGVRKSSVVNVVAAKLSYLAHRWVHGEFSGRNGGADLFSHDGLRRDMDGIRRFVLEAGRANGFLERAVADFARREKLDLRVNSDGETVVRFGAEQFAAFLFDPGTVRLAAGDALQPARRSGQTPDTAKLAADIGSMLDGSRGHAALGAFWELERRARAQTRGEQGFEFMLVIRRPRRDFHPPSGALRLFASAALVPVNWARQFIGGVLRGADAVRELPAVRRQIAELFSDVRSLEAQLWDAYDSGELDASLPPIVAGDQSGRSIGRVRDGDLVIGFNLKRDALRQLLEPLSLPKGAPFAPFARDPGVELTVGSVARPAGQPAVMPLFPLPVVSDGLLQSVAASGLAQSVVASQNDFDRVVPALRGYDGSGNAGAVQVAGADAKSVTRAVADAMGRNDFVVGYIGSVAEAASRADFSAARSAVEEADDAIAAVLARAREENAVVFITANRGLAESVPLSATHLPPLGTANPVPFYVYDPSQTPGRMVVSRANGTLSDVAPTVLSALGVAQPAGMTGSTLYRVEGRRKVVLLVVDGLGVVPKPDTQDAVTAAKTPNLTSLGALYGSARLAAHGPSVGLEPDEFGDALTGFYNIGAGRSPPRVAAVSVEDISRSENLLALLRRAKAAGSRVHLLGLLQSENGSRATLDQVRALLTAAKKEGLDDVFIHGVLDGVHGPLRDGARQLSIWNKVAESAGVGRIVTLMGSAFGLNDKEDWKKTERAYRALLGLPPASLAPVKAEPTAPAAGPEEKGPASQPGGAPLAPAAVEQLLPHPPPSWSQARVELVVADLRGWLDVRDGDVYLRNLGKQAVLEQIQRGHDVKAKGGHLLFSIVVDWSSLNLSEARRFQMQRRLIEQLGIPQDMVHPDLFFDVGQWKTPEAIGSKIQDVSGKGGWKTWKVWIVTDGMGAPWWEKLAAKMGWPTVAFQILDTGLDVTVSGAALDWLKSLLKDRYAYTDDEITRLIGAGHSVTLKGEKLGTQNLQNLGDEQRLFNIQA